MNKEAWIELAEFLATKYEIDKIDQTYAINQSEKANKKIRKAEKVYNISQDEIGLICLDATFIGITDIRYLITNQGIHINDPEASCESYVPFTKIVKVSDKGAMFKQYKRTVEITTDDPTDWNRIKYSSSFCECNKSYCFLGDLIRDILYYIRIQSSGFNNLQFVKKIIESYDKKFNGIYYPKRTIKDDDKIEGAVNIYATLKQDECVIFCYDDTFFGDASEGIVLTNKNLYINNADVHDTCIPISEIYVENIQPHITFDKEKKEEDKGIEISTTSGIIIVPSHYTKGRVFTEFIRCVLRDLLEVQNIELLKKDEEPEVINSECAEINNEDIVCSSCGKLLTSRDKFCPECGEKVVKKLLCSKCGAEIVSGMKFCSQCGTKIM